MCQYCSFPGEVPTSRWASDRGAKSHQPSSKEKEFDSAPAGGLQTGACKTRRKSTYTPGMSGTWDKAPTP